MIHAGNGALMLNEEEEGEEADVAHIEAALSLVWRALVVWLVVIGLLSFAL